MTAKIVDTRPHGVLRWGLRLPVWLYRAHLGWLLGGRFLMLTHIGRKTGLPHETVVEVVNHDRPTDTYYIAAGWGEKSDWFRNIEKTPDVVVNVGRRKFAATAARVPTAEAEREYLDYARRHPLAAAELTRLMLDQPTKNDQENAHRLANSVPLVALQSIRTGDV